MAGDMAGGRKTTPRSMTLFVTNGIASIRRLLVATALQPFGWKTVEF